MAVLAANIKSLCHTCWWGFTCLSI